jgi:hypothetical protein
VPIAQFGVPMSDLISGQRATNFLPESKQMIKKIKPAILFPLFLMYLPGVFGQVEKNIPDFLSQRFLKYCESVPRKEIFVHTDREVYIAGENIWFSLYVMDRQTSKISVNEHIAYFELLNQENRPVIQKRIRIVNGYGQGQVVLPDSLRTGSYTIRTYTGWMKNFLPENCFMKEIRIYNSFSKKAFIGKKYSETKQKVESNNDSAFGQSDPGLTMNVNNRRTDTLEIYISTDNRYRSANKNVFHLFIQTHGVINHVSSVSLFTNNIKISVPKNLLIPGINHITIFDSKGLPVCERYVYTPDKEKQFLTIQTKDSFKIREKVSLEIEMKNGLGNSLKGTNFSLTVTPVTDEKYTMELADYMLFGTEFGKIPQDKISGRKISDLSTAYIDSMLQTMKSNWIDWETILTGHLPGIKYLPESEDHYITGSLIERNIQTSGSGNYILMSLPGKEAVFQYSVTDKDGLFSFRLSIDDWLKDFVIQPAVSVGNSTIRIESSFPERYLAVISSVDSAYLSLPSFVGKWSTNYQVSKLYESSYIGEPLSPDLPPLKPKRFYGKPDIELYLDDYIKLPVMEEVFFELIPGVFLRNRKTGYELSINDPLDNKLYDKPPGMFVDGVVIRDPAVIANIDPEIVEKIEVVKNKYFVGDYLFYGIVNVISRAGDFNNVTLPDYAIRQQYRVLEPVWSFISPSYATKESLKSRIPDFRNTLYWNPCITPGIDGKVMVEFWTSDVKSNYIINIQGITSDGKLVTAQKIIKVE